MHLDELRELAQLYAIELSYDDAAGKKRRMSREMLFRALAARIPDFHAGADVRSLIRERQASTSHRFIEPVTVAWGRARPQVDLRMPRDAAEAEYVLELEDRSVREGRLPLTTSGWQTDSLVGRRLTLPPLPLGYHTLRVTAGGAAGRTLLIVAPRQAHAPGAKAWGIFAPPYAAVTRRSWGVADLSDLRSWLDWGRTFGAEFIGTLPMLATAGDSDPSPYAPVSRLFWNELYLDVRRLPEFDAGDIDQNALEEIRHVSSETRSIDYQAVAAFKRRVLEKMQKRFRPGDDFASFADTAGDYARFRAGETNGAGEGYHLYVQYSMSKQLREFDRALYLDFPLGVRSDGYDAVRFRPLFANASTGAPPDPFFTKGQNWGFAPFDPDALRESGYGYFRRALANHMQYASRLRIDHVMGLHRLYWIPQGAAATDGVYVRYPAEELYAVLLIESRRHRCAIIGEDLGTVPKSVPRAMRRHGLRGMFVFQYEAKPDGPLAEPPQQSIAAVNTHDMPTFAGFWGGLDIADRVEQGLLDTAGAEAEKITRQALRRHMAESLTARGLLHSGSDDTVAVLDAVFGYLSGSRAEMTLVNLEDLWLETEPQNRPGTTDRNWRRRFAHTLEEIQADEGIATLLRNLDRRQKTNNGHS